MNASATSSLSETSSGSPRDRDIVVFHFRPHMPYGKRRAIAFGLVAGGLILQALATSFWLGTPFLLAGSLLLCVRGYHNRVESGRFSPEATWETVDANRLEELMELDRKILRWNRSFMDASHPLGLFALLAILGPAGIVALHRMSGGFALFSRSVDMLILDAALILFPHWVTGIRRILRLPKLMVKVEAIRDIPNRTGAGIGKDRVSVMMLLKGAAKLPDDVKLRVQIDGAHKDFLGMYVQVVTNDVQGKSYPYLYAVLVAREGYGLKRHFDGFAPPKKVVKEFKRQDDVEILIVRQHTTKKSGYHTNAAAARRIFLASLALAREAARKD
jgi:hypothetical protein